MFATLCVVYDRPATGKKITWCYGQWESAYETLTRQVYHLSFEEGLPESSVCNPTTNNLVIIDDLMAETDARVTT